MRITVIDNGGLTKLKNGKFSCHHQTGMFGVELKKAGNGVEYFQIHTNGTPYVNNCILEDYGIKITSIKRRKSKFLTYLFAYFKVLLVVLKSDFVCVFWPSSFKYVSLIALAFGKKYGLYVRGEKDSRGKISNFIFKHAYMIASVTDSFTSRFSEMGIKRAFTIRPMIALRYEDIVRSRIFIQKKKFNLLFLGRIEKEKGIVELMSAFKELKKRYNYDVFLNIVGNGAEVKNIQTFIQVNNLSASVKLCGIINDIDDLREAYINSDIFVLPTYHEGFPRTLYEAMTFGTPIATTFVGGIPSLMVDKKNCYRLEPRSSKSIIRVLIEMMDNYSEMNKIVANSTLLAEKVLAPENLSFAASVLKILNDNSKANE